MGLENLVNVVFSLANTAVKFTNVYGKTGNLKKAAWYSGLYDMLYRN